MDTKKLIKLQMYNACFNLDTKLTFIYPVSLFYCKMFQCSALI